MRAYVANTDADWYATIAEQLRHEAHMHVQRKKLALTFGALRPERNARLSSATLVEIDRWVERVLTAKTIEEVLAD